MVRNTAKCPALATNSMPNRKPFAISGQAKQKILADQSCIFCWLLKVTSTKNTVLPMFEQRAWPIYMFSPDMERQRQRKQNKQVATTRMKLPRSSRKLRVRKIPSKSFQPWHIGRKPLRLWILHHRTQSDSQHERRKCFTRLATP